MAPRPTLTSLALAFQQFNTDMTNAMMRHAHNSVEQNQAAQAAQNKLFDELEKLGIANLIDWSL